MGVPRIPAASQSENHVAIFAIVAEGQVEEPMYLNYVFRMCRRKFQTTMQIHIVNEELAEIGENEHGSQPVARLRSLMIWLERYNPDFKLYKDDSAWLVCDRDDGGFSIKQLRTVASDCEKNRIHFILSNPAFQLWLLFHFTDNINIPLLNKSKYSKGKLKEIETMLRNYDPKYTHGTIDMTQYDYLLDTAITNSQVCPTSIDSLKRHVGTNFAELLEYIKVVYNFQNFNQIV